MFNSLNESILTIVIFGLAIVYILPGSSDITGNARLMTDDLQYSLTNISNPEPIDLGLGITLPSSVSRILNFVGFLIGLPVVILGYLAMFLGLSSVFPIWFWLPLSIGLIISFVVIGIRLFWGNE